MAKTPEEKAYHSEYLKTREVTYLPAPVKNKLDNYCSLRNMSKSEFIKDAVRDKLRQLNQL